MADLGPKTGKAPKGFTDVRCSRCSARRITRADGSPGACSLIGCKDPLHDERAESEGVTWKARSEAAEANYHRCLNTISEGRVAAMRIAERASEAEAQTALLRAALVAIATPGSTGVTIIAEDALRSIDGGRRFLAEMNALREVAAKATVFMQQVHRLPTGEAYDRARGDLFVAFCKLERERGDHA